MRKKRNQSQDGPDTAAFPEPKRLTPVDIQQREFRLAVRGYNEREVDQFLDEVTEEIARLYAENKRLREDLDIARRSGRGDPEPFDAESMVRSAREEAARILSEARARITAQ